MIVSIVVMCVIALLFIPIFGLTGFHIVLGRDSTAVTGRLNNYTFADFAPPAISLIFCFAL